MGRTFYRRDGCIRRPSNISRLRSATLRKILPEGTRRDAGKQGVTTADLDAIKTGLETIRDEIESGQFEWKTELEDVHMNIESRLIELIGNPGARLHTARSRNDQVATDLKLWLRRHIIKLCEAIDRMQDALLCICERDGDAVLPGYTHLQRAQPILFGHHLLAYFEMFERDRSRFMDCFERADESRRFRRLPVRPSRSIGNTQRPHLGLEPDNNASMASRIVILRWSLVRQRRDDGSSLALRRTRTLGRPGVWAVEIGMLSQQARVSCLTRRTLTFRSLSEVNLAAFLARLCH